MLDFKVTGLPVFLHKEQWKYFFFVLKIMKNRNMQGTVFSVLCDYRYI